MALLEFYGEECPHCRRMALLVERLEKDAGVKVEKFEIWHDDASARKYAEIEKGVCGGVPFFYNTESKESLCGEEDYETLKKWAKGPKA